MKSNHALKACLTVENRMPMTHILRQNSEPTATSVAKRLQLLCLDRGSVSATVNMPCTGFPAGEMIPVSVSINNETTNDIRILCPEQKRHVLYTCKQKICFPYYFKGIEFTYSARDSHLSREKYDNSRNYCSNNATMCLHQLGVFSGSDN